MTRRRQSVPRPASVGAMLTLLRLPHEPAEACANSRHDPDRVAMLTAPICSSLDPRGGFASWRAFSLPASSRHDPTDLVRGQA